MLHSNLAQQSAGNTLITHGLGTDLHPWLVILLLVLRRGISIMGVTATILAVAVMGASAGDVLPEGLGTRSSAQAHNQSLQNPDWLEPRGINIVDLVGEVPEQYLRGAIVSFAFGIVRYESGVRAGNTVTVTTTAYPRHAVVGNWDGTLFGCLGHLPYSDQMGSVSPPSKIRVFTPAGEDVTRQVDYHDYIPSGLSQPSLNPRQSESQGVYRYSMLGWRPPVLDGDGALVLPGNMGCQMIMSNRNYKMLKVVFVLQVERAIAVSVLGSQQFEFPVYTGPGNVGHFDALRNQLRSACVYPAPVTTADYSLNIPEGADFYFLNFPPIPVDAYTGWPANPVENADRPSSGTYRVRTPAGLSVDHVIATGLPLHGHWVDVDVAPADRFLTFSEVPGSFEPLEYVVPAGVSYDACMLTGTCPPEKLREICNTRTSARIVYLRVETVSYSARPISVRMSGANWQTGLSGAVVGTGSVTAPETSPGAASLPGQISGSHRIFLPIMRAWKPPVLPPIDDALKCDPRGGVGVFTSDGRMLDYFWCKS
jgi:hypothetical protein